MSSSFKAKQEDLQKMFKASLVSTPGDHLDSCEAGGFDDSGMAKQKPFNEPHSQ